MSAAREKLDKLQLARPKRPAGQIPDITHDITHISDESLMQYYESFRRWIDWLDVELAESQSEEAKALREMTFEENTAINKFSGEKNVSITKAKAALEACFIQRQAEYTEWKACTNHISVQKERALRAYNHCSRELSRRIAIKGKGNGNSGPNLGGWNE